MIKFNYTKLIEENSINVSDMSKDVQIGIKSIKGQERAIHMLEKSGKDATKAIEKIEREDRIVTAEIKEYLKEKAGTPPKNTAAADKAKAEAEKVRIEKEKQDKEAARKQKEEQLKTDPKSAEAEKELAAIIKSGKTVLTLDELKKSAPVAYSIIFDAYEPETENGVETSRYKCIETEKEKFTISKI